MTIMLVNNTGADIRIVEPAILEAIATGTALPDDLSDLFTLEVITIAGQVRGILNFA